MLSNRLFSLLPRARLVLWSRAPKAQWALVGSLGCGVYATTTALCGSDGDSPSTSIVQQILNPPPFTLHGERFDVSTYAGRACHFVNVLGDITTLVTTQDQLDESLELLKRFKLQQREGGTQSEPVASDAELWRARKLKEAIVHPETGEWIPAPVRFSAFAPVNLVLCAGLLSSATGSLIGTAFWQWANASYNVAVNYANRSSGSPPMDRIALAYAAATSSALAVALGMQAAGLRLEARLASGGVDGAQRSQMLVRQGVRLTVPMLAVALGAAVNLFFTRNSELSDGIPIMAADGQQLGHSKLAANEAIIKCAGSRVAWCFSLLTLAPLATGMAMRAIPAALAAQSPVAVAVDCCVSFFVIWLSVPLCIAIWPQMSTASPTDLEPEFHAMKHPITGITIDAVWFNRGL